MAICPVDGKGCCDDLCYGGQCVQSEHGESPLFHCDLCNKYHDEDDYLGVCDANDDEEWDDYEEDGPMDLEDQLDKALDKAFPENGREK